jgi:IMP dehydrogenase
MEVYEREVVRLKDSDKARTSFPKKIRAVSAIFIDIAHGHSKTMFKVLEHCVELFPDIDFIPGNVATTQGVIDLQERGAAAVKIGVGAGAACSTRGQTGFGVPQLSAIINCCAVAAVPIIADGGIIKSGDIVKSLAAGASTVMVGNLIAGTKEAAGNIINVDGVKFKVYRGAASKDSQLDWKGGEARFIYEEGVSSLVPYRGKVEDIIINAHNGIKSGLSYCGALNIKDLQDKAVFQLVSPNTPYENATRLRFGK